MSFLQQPSQKIFVQFLSGSMDELDTEETGPPCRVPPDDYVKVNSAVWIQGYVKEVNDENGGSVVLDDGTGCVLLPSCSKVASKIQVKTGIYLMVVGSVMRTGPQPVVKPVKLQDLSSQQHAATMWPLEVRDQVNFLTRRQQ